MLEFIRNINGPDFLVIYMVYSLVIIFSLKILNISMGSTRKLALNTDLDSYSISTLKSKSSIHNLAQTIIFKLFVEKYLEMKADGKSVTFEKVNKSTDSLNWIEKSVVEYFEIPKAYYTLLLDKIKSKDLKLYGKEVNKQLIEAGLMKSREQLRREKTFRSIAYLLLLSLGVTKLTMGLVNNKPVLFLVLEIILMSVVFFAVNHVSYLTREGKDYLNAKSDEYSWIRNGSRNSGFPSGMSEAVMGAALFGIASMYIYPEFGALSRSLGINSSSYASGTGCSNDGGGSGCSSSGCSSSGCGGGGCGGCGGN
jgi:uncharacterized protein (TIGR04222 family)